VIKKTYKRNKLAEQIVSLALKNDLIVFGGYVRDRDILGLDTFNDIDLACFCKCCYSSFLESLRNEFFTISVSEKPKESCEYVHMSSIISTVITINISGAYGVTFPENMHISIDVVFQKSKSIWEKTKDIDFSCNLFYRDNKSIGLRYVPSIDTNDSDAFTFWKTMTMKRKFYIVMDNLNSLNNDQVQKLLVRANKLVDKKWKMYYTENNPFTLGLYQMIKLKNQTQCSVCLNEFEADSLIVNTRCKHSFCNDCFQKVLRHSNKCPNCRGVICGIGKRDTWPPIIEEEIPFYSDSDSEDPAVIRNLERTSFNWQPARRVPAYNPPVLVVD